MLPTPPTRHRKVSSVDSNDSTRHRRGEYRACQTCGTTFYAYPSQLKAGRLRRFCSLACRAPAISQANKGKPKSEAARRKLSAARTGTSNPKRQKPAITLVCQGCANPFTVSGRQHWRAKVARFCSTACWYAYVRKTPGAHPRYTGTYLPYYGPNWLEQARKARRRDRYTCRDCGKRQTKPALDVHHLVARAAFGADYQSANALSNLVTLCKSCHTKREHAGKDN